MGSLIKMLLIEDDPGIQRLIGYHFSKEGFVIDTTDSGRQALIWVENKPYDVVILDWMLSDCQGIDVCGQLRRSAWTQNLPILMLTAKGEKNDKLAGFRVGSDDFMTKPFDMDELKARIHALLRRSKTTNTSVVEWRDVVLDDQKKQAFYKNQLVDLKPTEFRLLWFFLAHLDQVVERHQILDAVWGHITDVQPRTVDVWIGRLRKSLSPFGLDQFIITHRPYGYCFRSTTVTR